jgi:vibriolysin
MGEGFSMSFNESVRFKSSLFSIAAALVSLTGCLGTEEGPIGADGENFADGENLSDDGENSAVAVTSQALGTSEQTDASGEVHVQVVECSSASPAKVQRVSCSVGSDFVLIGGGARANYTKGAFITESRPTDGNLRTWIAASKDHLDSDAHSLLVYAVGLRLDGVSRTALMNQMKYTAGTASSSSNRPTATATLPSGYVILGGGAYVNWTGTSGLLLTLSAPTSTGASNTQWIAAAKDHGTEASGKVTAYAIGINPVIPGWGTLTYRTLPATLSFPSRVVGEVSVSTDSGWVLASVGARDEWSPGSGRLLTAMVPSPTSAMVRDKDHKLADDGVLTVYARQIRKF